jgi:Winged helix DNA-binding domain
MTAQTLTWSQVAAWRARRHHLGERAPVKALLEVSSDLAGLHAQLMSSAELTLWARVEGLDRGAVSRALWEDRSLVKTWAMRGTLHLLPAAEFAGWQAALSTRTLYLRASWLRASGVTLAELEQLLAAVGEALDGGILTRTELADEVARLTGSPAQGERLRESWGMFLKPAASRGLLCFGPSRGQLVCFTRPDRWLPEWHPEEPDAGLRAVAHSYLAASGPVTREEFARWWGIPSPAQALKIIRSLGDDVAQVQVDGGDAWALADDIPGMVTAEPIRSVRLLPAFDQWVVTATRHAEKLMAAPFADAVYRPQGWLSPVLLVDGRFAGVWQHERKGRQLAVLVKPFGAAPARVRRGVEDEAERLAAFLGGELELDWAPPS